LLLAGSLPAQAGVRPEFTLSGGVASHESSTRRYHFGASSYPVDYVDAELVTDKGVNWSADAGAMFHPNWSLGMRFQHSEYTTEGAYVFLAPQGSVEVRPAAVGEWYMAPRVTGFTPAWKIGPDASKLKIRVFGQAGIGARYSLWQEQTFLLGEEFRALSASGSWSFAGHLGGGLLFGGETGVGLIVSAQLAMAADSPEPAANEDAGGRSWWTLEAGLRFSPPAVPDQAGISP
jgi:hypothetical protein